MSFRYLTSYRCYTIAKIGFALSYLWYVCDFFRIHSAYWHRGLGVLLARTAEPVFSGDYDIDALLQPLARSMDGQLAVWLMVLLAPLAVALFLWGRRKWLQFGVGLWISGTMVSLTALIDVFHSKADVWVNLAFLAYSIAALTSSRQSWEENELGFSIARWRANETCSSAYAWMIVWLEFTVYLFAGIDKLKDGWVPWTRGIAIQNLIAYDNSIYDFAHGAHVPFWLSLVLCYVTLVQRLVVPFGFFFQRFRLWSVVILGTMHIGYACLMHVNLFPLIGIASLVIVWPPRPAVPVKKMRQLKKPSRKWVQAGVVSTVSIALLLECVRLATSAAVPWENSLLMSPSWGMFSNGGLTPAGNWKLFLNTQQGPVDVTQVALEPLPSSWRDRFYENIIYYDVMRKNMGRDSMVGTLVSYTQARYIRERHLAHQDSTIYGAYFSVTFLDQRGKIAIPSSYLSQQSNAEPQLGSQSAFRLGIGERSNPSMR